LYASPCKHEKGKGFRGKIATELNLTEDQQKGFDEIMHNQRESMKVAMKTVHANSNIELAKILTPDQMKLLEQKKSQRHSKMKKRMRANY
jgi:Spy/CpxP family protein refolding chaperone